MNAALKDKNLFYIGGIVRDELLGIESFDTDITYQGNVIEFCKKLQSDGIGKIKQINPDFGTVKMIIDNQQIDFASTRDEIYTKKGHLPVVSNLGCELKKDVLRRDFTVNAIAKSLSNGEIIDYTGGVEDLKNKTLRILYDNSFIDDPTRIVRGLKFSVRFGFELDEHTKKLQENYLNNINYDMSYKRLKKELTETFNLNSQKAFEMFFNRNIYKLLDPKEINPPEYDIETLIKKYPVKHIWLVYLGWLNLEKLPLTKEEQKIVDDYNLLMKTVVQDDKISVCKTFNNKSRESMLLYTIMTGSSNAIKYFELENIRISINGNDLEKLNIPPSPLYKDCFDYILSQKLENPK
ncbi:MAG: hypothetical protein LUB59_04325, partial [Candidatus Gastranaerophilales bacterium]|nr:hypothetical protein [Candidatus Gastranaerophilales bacterium]